MSDIAPIGSTGTPPSPSQAPAGGEAVGQSAAATSTAGATSIQQTHQSMSTSISSQVQMMMGQYGIDMQSDEASRQLVVLMLLVQLLELLEGESEEGQLMVAPLGQGYGGTFLLYSASTYMESSSYQMTATQAYASASSSSAAGAAPDAVAPADTQGTADAGDGGSQLNVVA